MRTTVNRAQQADEAVVDAALMERVHRRDRDAFAILLQRHHQRCFQLAWRVTADRHESEDILQDVFMLVWQRPERFDASKGMFGAWLTRVVINAALDSRRRIKPVNTLDDIATLASSAPTPDSLAEAMDLHRLLLDLTPRQRTVVSLFYIEGHTMAEIATILDTRIEAVESLLSRGRSALRTMVTRDDTTHRVGGTHHD